MPSAIFVSFLVSFFFEAKKKVLLSFLVILYYILYPLYFRATSGPGYLYESTRYLNKSTTGQDSEPT